MLSVARLLFGLTALGVSSVVAEQGALERRQAAADKYCFTPAGATPSLCVQASVVGTNAQFAVYGSSSNNYYGLGFGRFMADADMVLLWVNAGNIVISDRSSNFRGNPTPDQGQNLVLDATNSKVNGDGSFVAIFTRPLAAADNSDKAITPNAEAPYMAAIGPNPNSADPATVLTYHSFRTNGLANPFQFPVGGAAVAPSPSPSRAAAPSPSRSPAAPSPSSSPSRGAAPSVTPTRSAAASPSPRVSSAVSPTPRASTAVSPTPRASTAASPTPIAGPGGAGNPVCFTQTPASYCVSMALVTDTNQIRVTMTVGSSTNWAGLGVGTGMADADTWIAAVSNGQIVLQDGASSGYAAPTADGTQSLILDPVLSKVNADGSWVAVFYRDATPTDPTDKPVAVKTAGSFIWGIGTFDPATATYGVHAARGAVNSNLFVDADITSADTNQNPVTDPTNPDGDDGDTTDPAQSPTPGDAGLGNDNTGDQSSAMSLTPSFASSMFLGSVVLLAGMFA